MTLGFLLDTSIVSAVVWKNPDRTAIERFDRHRGECAIAAPTWHELMFGMARLPSGKRRGELRDYLFDVVRAEFPILAYDEPAAAWHAEERVRLAADGRTAPFIDGQIAAVAHVNGLVLVTRNLKDFAGFSNLHLEDWRK